MSHATLIPRKDATALKVFLILVCFAFCYVMVYFYATELHTQRYPGVFAGFVEMYLHGYVNSDILSLVPYFNHDFVVDPMLPHKVQGIISSQSYWPNFVSFFLILHYFTGLPVQTLLIVPVGIIFIPVAVLLLLRTYLPDCSKDTGTRWVFWMLFTYLIIYFLTTKLYGSFYVPPPSFMISVVILFCLWRFFEDTSRMITWLALIGVMVFSLAHYWHTSHMGIVAIITSVWVISAIFLVISRVRPDLIEGHKSVPGAFFRRSSYVLAITLVISLFASHLWRANYLERYLEEADLAEYLAKAYLKLSGEVAFPVPYVFNYKDLLFGRVAFYSYLTILAVSVLLILAALYYYLISRRRVRFNAGNPFPITITLAVILAQVVVAVLYYKSNAIDFSLVPIYFPVMGSMLLLSLREPSDLHPKAGRFWNPATLLMALLGVLIICSALFVGSAVMTSQGGTSSETRFADTEGSFSFIYGYGSGGERLILDFNILGKYLQREGRIAKPRLEYTDLTPLIYQSLVGDPVTLQRNLTGNYVVVDHLTMSRGLPIHVTSSRAMLVPELARINGWPGQDKIYMDRAVSIFQVRNYSNAAGSPKAAA